MIPANYKQAIDEIKWTDKLLMELIEFSRDHHQLGYKPALLGFMEALNLRDMQNLMSETAWIKGETRKGIRMEYKDGSTETFMENKYPEGILSFKSPVDFIVEKSAKEYIDCDYHEWVHIWLTKFGSKIWSVQNGNEVLTVGDRVFDNDGKEPITIESFKIEDNHIVARGWHFSRIVPHCVKFKPQKTYTESDMRKCFEEARLTKPDSFGYAHLYRTFDDYLNPK